MIIKPVAPRAKAREDVEKALDHYVHEAGPDVALAFINALEAAYALIAETPGAGSPRWSHDLKLPDLRTMRLKALPWLVFYIEQEAHVDV